MIQRRSFKLYFYQSTHAPGLFPDLAIRDPGDFRGGAIVTGNATPENSRDPHAAHARNAMRA